MTTKPEIAVITTMGDSLTDKSTLHSRHFCFAPVSLLSKQGYKIPQQNLAHGFIWSDYLATILADELIIGSLVEKHSYEKIKMLLSSYNLDDNPAVNFFDGVFLYALNESGLTVFKYHFWPTKDITKSASELSLPTLAKQGQAFIKHASQKKVPQDYKNKMLIINFSGINDLIANHKHLTLDVVQRSITEQLRHIEKLYQRGYKHILLCNLFNLALTPHYQSKSEQERDQVSACVDEFNNQLIIMAKKITDHYINSSVNIFDLHAEFNKIYQDPETFMLDPKKLSLSLKASTENTTEQGYLFWDDFYPTSDVHAYLAYAMFEYLKKIYMLVPGKNSYGKTLQSQILFQPG